jgi:hypothetical protein
MYKILLSVFIVACVAFFAPIIVQACEGKECIGHEVNCDNFTHVGRVYLVDHIFGINEQLDASFSEGALFVDIYSGTIVSEITLELHGDSVFLARMGCCVQQNITVVWGREEHHLVMHIVPNPIPGGYPSYLRRMICSSVTVRSTLRCLSCGHSGQTTTLTFPGCGRDVCA